MIKWIWSLSEDIELDRAAQSAVDTGHLDVVMKKVDIESLGLRGAHIELDQACSNGHIAVVQWLIQHFPGQCCVMSADLEAARKGRRDIVQLLHLNKIEGCSWQTIGSTASQGQVDIVKWLRLQSYYHQSDLSLVPMLLTAPHEMDIQVVKWFHENTSIRCSVSAMDGAAANGHFETVRWLHENRSEGCSTGDLRLMEWLSKNRTEGCTTHAMDLAADRGHLDVVKWLHHNRHEGCTIKAMNHAASNGHLEVVKWLHNNRTEGCKTDTMDGAAEKGSSMSLVTETKAVPLVQWRDPSKTTTGM